MLRIGYTGSPGAWEGVVRDDAGVIVVRCGHTHPNPRHFRETHGVTVYEWRQRRRALQEA